MLTGLQAVFLVHIAVAEGSTVDGRHPAWPHVYCILPYT